MKRDIGMEKCINYVVVESPIVKRRYCLDALFAAK